MRPIWMPKAPHVDLDDLLELLDVRHKRSFLAWVGDDGMIYSVVHLRSRAS